MSAEHHAIKLSSFGFTQGTRAIQSTYPHLRGMMIVTEIINRCSTAPKGKRPEAKTDPRQQFNFNSLASFAVLADIIFPA